MNIPANCYDTHPRPASPRRLLTKHHHHPFFAPCVLLAMSRHDSTSLYATSAAFPTFTSHVYTPQPILNSTPLNMMFTMQMICLLGMMMCLGLPAQAGQSSMSLAACGFAPFDTIDTQSMPHHRML